MHSGRKRQDCRRQPAHLVCEMYRRVLRQRILLYALIVFILVWLVLLLGPVLWRATQETAIASLQDAQSRELERAIHQWEQQGPRTYRLTITIGGKWGECLKHLTIESDIKVTTVEDSCTASFGAQMHRYVGSPATVRDLFHYVETAIDLRSCGPNGCRCDGALSVEAAYDEDLGYPLFINTQFKRHWTTMPWPLSPESAQGCTLIGTILPEHVRVLVEAVE